MLGAITGDTIDSVYEFNNTKDYNFNLFLSESAYTDDSVMTMAVAYWLLRDPSHSYQQLEDIMVDFAQHCPCPMGGDSDTLACITGGVAEAFYGGVPASMAERVMHPWPDAFRKILEAMRKKTAPAVVMATARQGLFLIPALFAGRALLGFTGVEIAQTVSDGCAFLLSLPLTVSALRGMGKD